MIVDDSDHFIDQNLFGGLRVRLPLTLFVTLHVICLLTCMSCASPRFVCYAAMQRALDWACSTAEERLKNELLDNIVRMVLLFQSRPTLFVMPHSACLLTHAPCPLSRFVCIVRAQRGLDWSCSGAEERLENELLHWATVGDGACAEPVLQAGVGWQNLRGHRPAAAYIPRASPWWAWSSGRAVGGAQGHGHVRLLQVEKSEESASGDRSRSRALSTVTAGYGPCERNPACQRSAGDRSGGWPCVLIHRVPAGAPLHDCYSA